MQILDYLKKLLPSISKSDLTEDLRITINELDNICIPSYEDASDYLKSNKPKSNDVEVLTFKFYKSFDLQSSSKQATVVGEILKRLPFIRDNAIFLKEQAEEVLDSVIVTQAISAKHAMIIRSSDSISFIVKYSIDFLTYILYKEAINNNAEIDESVNLSPSAIKFVEKNIVQYATMLSDFGIPNNDFSKIINGIADVIFSDKTANSVKATYGERKLDPFSRSYVSGFTGSPIYHFRMVIAEYQNKSYKNSQSKKKNLELRLLFLKNQRSDKNNPKLEKEISVTQSRVDKLQYELDKYNSELG